MKLTHTTKKWIGFIILLTLLCFCCRYLQHRMSFVEITSQSIFKEYIWRDTGLTTTDVSNIIGIEGAFAFTSTGPAFVRFNASDQFIIKLIKTKFTWYEVYSPISCDRVLTLSKNHDLINSFPEKFTWWRLEEISSPICYQAQGTQGDDYRYLLIGPKENMVYFYQNASCGLCPD